MTTPGTVRWRTSTYSASGTNCVEVGPTPTVIGIRDTKNRDAGTIAVSAYAWSVFVSSVKSR